MSTTICQECKGRSGSAAAFHPWLYCELVKLGHHDPEGYLRSYGFERVPVAASPSLEET